MKKRRAVLDARNAASRHAQHGDGDGGGDGGGDDDDRDDEETSSSASDDEVDGPDESRASRCFMCYPRQLRSQQPFFSKFERHLNTTNKRVASSTRSDVSARPVA
jgi:hypothetical protein